MCLKLCLSTLESLHFFDVALLLAHVSCLCTAHVHCQRQTTLFIVDPPPTAAAQSCSQFGCGKTFWSPAAFCKKTNLSRDGGGPYKVCSPLRSKLARPNHCV